MKLTEKELELMALFIAQSFETCGAFDDNENLSYCNAQDLSEITGYNRMVIGGVIGSLVNKNLIINTKGSAREAKIPDFVGCPINCEKVPELKKIIDNHRA